MIEKISNMASLSKGLSLCLLLCCVTSCNRTAVVQKNPETIEAPQVSSNELVEMTLYFPKSDGSGVFQNKVMVDDRKKNPTMWLQLMIEQLSQAPNAVTMPVFAERVELYSVFLDKEIIYVDFAANIQKLPFSNIQMQELALQAFLSSVKANFLDVRYLKFLVEHEDRDVIFGHLYAQQPFSL